MGFFEKEGKINIHEEKNLPHLQFGLPQTTRSSLCFFNEIYDEV